MSLTFGWILSQKLNSDIVGIGWLISAIGVAQLPIWAVYAIYNQKGIGFLKVNFLLNNNVYLLLQIILTILHHLIQKFYASFKPTDDWGPLDPLTRKRYLEFMSHRRNNLFRRNGLWNRIKDNIFGWSWSLESI